MKSLFFALTVFLGWTASAKDYYVERAHTNARDTTSNGSEAAPFFSIGYCTSVAVNPGDTCWVKNGTYPEPVYLSYSGTATSPISLKNYPGHRPVVRFADKTYGSSRIEVLNRSGSQYAIGYINIEGLEITNAYNGIKLNSAHHVTIQKNKIHDTWYAGILGFGYQNTINGNEVFHCGDFRLVAPLHTHCMYLTGQKWTITNNIVYDSVLYGMQLAAYIYKGTADSPDANYAGFSGVVAHNTIAYTLKDSGIVVWDAGTGGGGYNPALLHDIDISNNIFYEVPGGITFMNSGAYTNITVRNNVSYSTKSPNVFIIGGTINSTYSLSGNCPSLPSGNCTSNPNFKYAPASLPPLPDFHLTSSSTVAIDRALNLGIFSDIAGSLRPQGNGFDIGAYEFVSGTTGSRPLPPTHLQAY
jgi:hypothetical protein